jgi:hypothetical protein
MDVLDVQLVRLQPAGHDARGQRAVVTGELHEAADAGAVEGVELGPVDVRRDEAIALVVAGQRPVEGQGEGEPAPGVVPPPPSSPPWSWSLESVVAMRAPARGPFLARAALRAGRAAGRRSREKVRQGQTNAARGPRRAAVPTGAHLA